MAILENPILHDQTLSLLRYPCALVSQMADDWMATYCINKDGFPNVLYAATI
jgi:hypothetical protein